MAHRGRRDPSVIGYDDHVAFRYSDYDTPFWARSNTEPGRWNAAGQVPTQYLAFHPDGAWAELARAENLQTEQDLTLIRMPIWAARLSEQGLADYSDFGRAEAAGFPPDALIDDDYSRCQAEGARLRELGYRGVVAPSAALPGCLNLTLFGPRIISGWSRERKLASSIPAAVVAVGAPAAGLAGRVRLFGRPHAGHDEYRRDRNRARRRSR